MLLLMLLVSVLAVISAANDETTAQQSLDTSYVSGTLMSQPVASSV
jgi:hypothetical protein